MSGTANDVLGTPSAIVNMNTEYESRSVTPILIFSPAAGGTKYTNNTRTDRIRDGTIMFIM